MSSGPVCRYPAATRSSTIPHPELHDHVVYARNHNNSAFSGYHYTPSDYSGIVCLQTWKPWRAKGQYVDRLPDITPEQHDAWLHGPAPERTV